MSSVKHVLSCGTFDLLHPGHSDFLRQAASLGARLSVVIARDENVLRLKGRLPVEDQQTRLENVRGLAMVDQAHLGYPGSDFLRIVTDLEPDIIALGYDQRAPVGLAAAFPRCQLIVLEPYHPDKFKTTFYRDRLENGDNPEGDQTKEEERC
jgi:cytidyltransferase-like protein